MKTYLNMFKLGQQVTYRAKIDACTDYDKTMITRLPKSSANSWIQARQTQAQRSRRLHRHICMASAKPLAVISGTAKIHGIGRECARQFLEVVVCKPAD